MQILIIVLILIINIVIAKKYLNIFALNNKISNKVAFTVRNKAQVKKTTKNIPVAQTVEHGNNT